MPALAKLYVIVLSTFLLSASSVNATPLRVEGKLIYDEALDVYWAKSEKSDIPLTWESAKNWINELNIKEFGGYSDWRLPDTPDGTWGFDGKNDKKYNVTVSELGHLYYTTLGLNSKQNDSEYSSDELAKKALPFSNMQPDLYWFGRLSNTRLNADKPNGDPAAWVFDFGYGSQFLETTNMFAYAIAVRSATHVPEPSSVVLFLTGLLALTQIRSRQNH